MASCILRLHFLEMKFKSPALVQFIQDFGLLGAQDVVCFDAIVHFITNNQKIELRSEVHIIHIQSQQLDVVYLLHPQVTAQRIPSAFTNNDHLQYNKDEMLFLRGFSYIHGRYVLSVHPQNRRCSDDILQKIFSDWNQVPGNN